MRRALTRRTLLAAAASLPGWRAHAGPGRPLPPVAEQDAVVAFAHIGPITDGGWTTTHHRGLLALERAFPRATYLEVASLPLSEDATRTFRQFVESGANIVFVTSEWGDLLSSVAEDAPEVAFLECNGHTLAANLSSYYIQHWMAAYVLGIAAGGMSRSGRLGFVGSLPVASVYAASNAFLLGARTVNPSAELRCVLINAWFDPQASSQAASALVGDGCDVLFEILDDTSVLQVAEKAGVRAFTWNTDMRAAGPHAYVNTVLIDWDPFYREQLRSRLAGTWRGGTMTMLPIGHGVDRGPWGADVPARVCAPAEAMRTRILAGYNPFVGEIRDSSGRVRVPAGQAMSADALYVWDWPMQGVSGLPLG